MRWAVLMLGSALACSESSDDGRPRIGPGGAAGASGASAIAGAAGSAGAGTGNAGAGAGGAPSTSPVLRLGEPLELVAGAGDVPYAIGPNPYGIRGGGFLSRSPLGNTISIGQEPGQICISGNVQEVPNGDYSQYWGVEIGFNLNQGPSGAESPVTAVDAVDSGAPLDAGTPLDAAAPGDAAAPEVARPWLPGDVIGFSFVIEGPTINLIRFKGLPTGYDPALESSVFCKGIQATSGQEQTALFSELTQYCWSSQDVPIPATSGLANISWQLPADVAPAGVRAFDWCLKDLRPILAP